MELRERVARELHRWQWPNGMPWHCIVDAGKDREYLLVADCILAIFAADTARREREAFVAGAAWSALFQEGNAEWYVESKDDAEAEAARRYPEAKA